LAGRRKILGAALAGEAGFASDCIRRSHDTFHDDKPRDNLKESSKHKPSRTLATSTTDKLEDLGAEIKRQERSSLKQSDTWPPNVSVRKRSIGYGPSLTTSIRTTYPDKSRRVPGKDASPKRVSSPKSQSTSLGRSRDLDESEIVRPPASGKRLFEPDSDSPFVAKTTFPSNSDQGPRSRVQQRQHRKNQKSSQSGGGQPFSQRPISSGEPGVISASVLGNLPASQQEAPSQGPPKIVRQPETRPISQEQLVAEVKGIYAGLVMVEGKCIQVDAKQAALAREAPPGTQPKLNNEQWQALIALHRTLLHEHHDFFLASQHPSATPAVRRLAIKYAMPARLWRHGIHSFLELLRNRLPDSLDHMLAFIYLAYSMMTLLYETAPAFEETWIECLGDLGRYRMAIEDDDIRDREVWTQVARQWYLKASDCSPKIGRLYHHLAILARPNALQQLFYYKALSEPQSFITERVSILKLVGNQSMSNEQRSKLLKREYQILYGKNKRSSTRSGKMSNILPILLNGRKARVSADTGASANFIDVSLASDIVRDENCPSFTLPNGNKYQPIGKSRELVQFPGEPDTMEYREFWVVENPVTRITLGEPFLMETKTLMRCNRHRFSGRAERMVKKPLLRLVGIQQKRLRATVNGRQVNILPDTGSEINVMPHQWALDNDIEVDYSSQRFVQYMDRSIKKTVGTAYTRVAPGYDSDEDYLMRWDVMDGPNEELIWGSDYLFDHAIYDHHEKEFITIDSNGHDLGPIELLDGAHAVIHRTIESVKSPFKHNRRRPKRPTFVVRNDIDDRMLEEIHRREQEDARIQGLPPGERPAAEAAEQLQRDKFDHRQRVSRQDDET
jgi:hypothetical protein